MFLLYIFCVDSPRYAEDIGAISTRFLYKISNDLKNIMFINNILIRKTYEKKEKYMSENYRIIGRKPDGTLNICRAKPEFRGKGNCKHQEHIELPEKTNITQYINEHNEKILEQQNGLFNNVIKDDKNFPQDINEDNIKTQDNGYALKKQELINGAMEIAQSFPYENFEFIKQFNKDLHDRKSNNQIHKKFTTLAENIEDFLKNSNTESVKKVREFLGKEVDLADFADIMVFQVRAMTAAEKWGSKRVSINRAVLTTLNNDMTKERYVASILFFGGRCCYCNRTLRKMPPPHHQATGEHITPISPENKNNVHGGTKYGNMALACSSCNHDRGNTELVEWVQKTKCIREENKQAVLGRIEAFRKFALYHEYTPEESQIIDKKLQELINLDLSLRKPSGGYIEGGKEKITAEIKIALYDLKNPEQEEDNIKNKHNN